jgi:CheY-like chemotaxis protein
VLDSRIIDTANAAAPMVVVVDDDPVAQQILYQHLSSAGYAIRAVGDSREALSTIEELQPQLVILDIQMPYKDGWEVLTELRMSPTTADIPVVLCSILDEQRLGLALGANDYLVKPVRAERLLPALRRWLEPAASVLVIDDEAESRQILRAILEQADYIVREADNGRSGLAAVASAAPDMIVLDLMIPELDGFQVLAQLRADPRYADLPVIVVTAKDLTTQEQVWLQECAQLAVQKNQFTPSEFVAQLHNMIRKEPSHAD